MPSTVSLHRDPRALATPDATGADRAAAPADGAIERRRWPYPFKARLAVCSDLDLTPDGDTYLETLRFLNTRESTRFGTGLGLEVGNTIYFDMAPDQFSYWGASDRERELVRFLIRSGHVDCLHSFGDLATSRTHAGRALDELDRHDCRLGVWIDHAVAPTNFGADIMHGHGDVVGSPAYHADLTWAYGIRYVWRGRVTSVVGQDVPRRLGGIFDRTHPLASTVTVGKELVKGLAARAGSRKYQSHAPNRVLWPATLRSGHPIQEFLRANPHWGGVSRGDTGDGISEVLRASTLTRLADRGGASIIYTHLGKTSQPGGLAVARDALARLAHLHHTGQILVSTTRRLLAYCQAMREIRWSHHGSDDQIVIEVRTDRSTTPDRDLEGLTFYVSDPHRTTVRLNGTEVPDLVRNQPDESGRPSISVPRHALEFPQL